MSNATHAIGRRKAAIARVIMKKGDGKFMVNKKTFDVYFNVEHHLLQAVEPLAVIEGKKDYDIQVNVNGGGIKGQAEAIRLGIARALCEINPDFRPSLKAKGLLTRDSRVVERKKPGLKKARKKTQYSKR